MATQGLTLMDVESGFVYRLETTSDILTQSYNIKLPEKNGNLALVSDIVDALVSKLDADAKALDSERLNGLTSDQYLQSILVGAVNGVAGLDAGGKVPAAQLPSFVDDVLEYADFASLPVAGEAGKIYVTLDDNKAFRWGGTSYTYITSGAVDSVNGQTGIVNIVNITGNAGTATKLAAARNITLSGDATGTVAFDGSGNVTLTVTILDDSHAHIIANIDGLQAALDGKLSATGKAVDSYKLEGLSSSAFARQKATATVYGGAKMSLSGSTLTITTT